MSDPLDRLALAETPDDVAAVLAEAPHLAADAARWRAVRVAVREGLAADLPDADLLVLRGMDAADLTDAEQTRLHAARPALDAAFGRHPGLSAAADRVVADRVAFDRTWREHVSSAEPAAEPSRPGPRRTDHAGDRAARPAPRRGGSRWVWRTAALAGVAAFAVVALFVAQRDAGFQTVTAETARTVTLADGSTADLAAGAVLMVPEPGGRRGARQARLRSGDALFHVAHDPARPFTVETPNADVTVLGTVFAVRVAGAETNGVRTDVTLLSGRVDLALRGGPSVRLAPGQASRVVALQPPTAPVAADPAEALAWMGDVVVRDEPSRAVAARLGSLFGAEITVDDVLASETVSADFRLADGRDAAVEALAMALGGRADVSGRAVRIVAD
jgi:transmembrane sensor